jgi:uncharacterized iron-regulated protein
MKYLKIFLLSLIPIVANAQNDHFKIYSTQKQSVATIDDIIADMGKADVLFFGEEHNDSVGHVMELRLLQKLQERYPGQAVLSMEMFETDCQTVLNEYLTGLIREKNFLTDARVWRNYKDYRPLIEFAKSGQMPVIAANAPGRYTNMVNRLGLNSLNGLDDNAKHWLPPLPIDTATGAYYEKFVKIMGGHGAMAGMQLYQAQNLWDATMGWSISRYFKARKNVKIFQVNGGFHSEEKLGTAAQLLHYSPKIKLINVAAYADDSFENPDWSKYSKMADYIIITDPKVPKTY